MRRAERLWEKWDEAVENQRDMREFVDELSDESLLGLLAASDPGERRYELNVLLSATMNRIIQMREQVKDATEESTAAIDRMQDAIHYAQRLVQKAEAAHSLAVEKHAENVEKAQSAVGDAAEDAAAARDRLNDARAAATRHAQDEA